MDIGSVFEEEFADISFASAGSEGESSAVGGVGKLESGAFVEEQFCGVVEAAVGCGHEGGPTIV